jgi:hypothetical protein
MSSVVYDLEQLNFEYEIETDVERRYHGLRRRVISEFSWRNKCSNPNLGMVSLQSFNYCAM